MNTPSDDVERVLAGLSPEKIEAHLRLLASPLLEGRGIGSRGGRMAEEYIRAVFAAAGLSTPPGMSYRQEVPMIGLDPRPALHLASKADVFEPRYRDDYVLSPGMPEESVDIDADLVFVGYGIDAPEYDWNDYADVDVKGKTLLMRVNDPGTQDTPDFFGGRALTYYGRWTYKFEEAARRGAAGALLIHTDGSAGYGWAVVRNSNSGEQYQLASKPRFPLGIRGWVTEDVSRRILEASGGADRLLALSGQRSFRPIETGFRVRATINSSLREATTANVMAVLPGSDPRRAEEPVILMAHHDHLGTVAGESEPVIYHGAHDNASGVALLLAMAQALAQSGVRPARPIVFLASTAEESGLLGAEWYSQEPRYPLLTTAAVLNVDGANLEGPTDDIAPLGVDRSTLGAVVLAAATAEGLEVAEDQHPEQGSFFRQDHFPFARAGVPGIAFNHGLRYRDRPEGWGEEMHREFIAKHYHQPTDAFREDFDYRGAIQQGRVILRTAISVAQADELPAWMPDSPFQRQ